MNRMLVIGAGATIEECIRSGAMPNNPEWAFPTISNFCNRLFDPLPTPHLTLTETEVKVTSTTTSGALLAATANYLLNQQISFDDRFLKPQDGDTYTTEDLTRNPVVIFCDLEKQDPHLHNIETLCEFTWQLWGNKSEYWNSFIHEGIYFKLSTCFSMQFGFGNNLKFMKAGNKVCSILNIEDIVLNLNYDIAFDLALQQSQKLFSYSPELLPNTISVLKPHGSFNLYTTHQRPVKDHIFLQPDRLKTFGAIEKHKGKRLSPYGGIIPPRLNKNYEQHPLAKEILGVGRPLSPKIITFWGVGLTPSDIDLLTVYREASENAIAIEFINPNPDAHKKSEKLLDRQIKYFPTLHSWFDFYRIPD